MDDFMLGIDYEPNILFLKDIFPIENTNNFELELGFTENANDDISEYNFDIIERALSVNKVGIKYDTIPIFYINRDLWLKNTNLHCWNCDATPMKCPYTIPVHKSKINIPVDIKLSEIVDISQLNTPEILMNKNEKKMREVSIQQARGVFCSLGCASYYLINIPDTHIARKKWQATELLKQLHKKWTGEDIISLPIVLPKTEMKKYCGESGITYNKYLESHKTYNKII